jgi:phosphatidylserine/phosphatidylglycerophosphate/cardiolipin synthase-like enzyme
MYNAYSFKEMLMRKTFFAAICLCFILTCSPSGAYDLTLNKTPVQVYFSPKGGCAEAIIAEINGAKQNI